MFWRIFKSHNCFKGLLGNKRRIQEKVITMPTQSLSLIIPYLEPVSLQTITKLKKFLKCILNFCKLPIVFKSRKTLTKAFYFKCHIPEELISSVIFKFQSGICNEPYYCECVRHLSVRIGEYIGISSKPLVSAVSDCLILCSYSPCFECLSVLTKGKKKFVLELK